MKPTRRSHCHLILLLCLLAVAAVARPGALLAQSTKIFVASYGNDANDGSRGSPKRTFQLAHDAVATDGQIVVLDTAGYGALAITKSLTITVPPGVNGFITVTGDNNGITINAPSVVLRGLIIEGGGQNAAGTGIVGAMTSSNLVVDRCTVRSFHTGIALPTAVVARSYLLLSESVFLGCYDGVVIGETANVAAATITDCRFELNSHAGLGLVVPQGRAEVYVADSLFSRNGIGILCSCTGSFANIFVSNCNLTGNDTGLSSQPPKGRNLTRSNNTVVNPAGTNSFDGTFSAQ